MFVVIPGQEDQQEGNSVEVIVVVVNALGNVVSASSSMILADTCKSHKTEQRRQN